MSLFAPKTPPTREENRALLLAQEVEQILDAPRRTAEQIVAQWERDFSALWRAGAFTPAQRLAAIGTKAAELFTANTAWTTALIQLLSGKRDDLVARITANLAEIPAYAAHEDGSVTLN